MSDVLAPTTVEVVYRWVATIFKAAVADRLIPASPCIRIALPEQDRSEVVPLEVAQVEALADAVNRRYRPMVIFTAGMGLPPGEVSGEVFGLTTDRVDFLHRQVRVDRQLIGVQNGRPEFGPPKSAAGYRTVPMPAVVTDVVAAHLARFRPRKFGLVFTNTYGDPLRKSTFSDQWRHAARIAGVPDSVTFHDLRHFYASLLIAKGCSIKAVQKRLGHESAMETLDTYSHLWPDSDDETRAARRHGLQPPRPGGMTLGRQQLATGARDSGKGNPRSKAEPEASVRRGAAPSSPAVRRPRFFMVMALPDGAAWPAVPQRAPLSAPLQGP